MIKLTQIKPNPNNPRLIKDDKFKKLVKSLEEFPEMMEKRPIVCVTDVDGKIYPLGGNMRLKAIKELNYKEIPDTWVTMADEWTEEKRREFVVKDNVGFGEWDWDQLAEWDSEQLEDWGLELPASLEVHLEAEEDDYDGTLPEEPITVLGDLYEIGEHRLLCGDSTDSDQVARLMNGEKADMVFTDPPYNIGYKGTMSNTTTNGVEVGHVAISAKYDDIKNDKMNEDDFYNFICDILKEIKLNCKGAYYISFGSQTLLQLLKPLNDLDIEYKSIIIWMKNQSTISGKDFKSRYEPIVYGRFNDAFYGERFNQEDIWEFQRTLKNDLHPTMKPIPLIENALNYSSKEGMKVMDLFLGSGSTMVASHQLKRKCYGMELDPKYCDVIVKRMVKLDPTLTVKRNGIDCKKDFE
jgi:DNA modification methylase